MKTLSETIAGKQAQSLSLIICTYRRPFAVRRLLGSLKGQTIQPDEIIIVDSSPDNDTGQIDLEFTDSSETFEIRYHHVSSEHRGITRQRNYGITHARGDIIAFLDDDTVPEPDYFKEIKGCFDRHPDAIGIGGYIANEVKWKRKKSGKRSSFSVFRGGEWERREDFRWRLRKLLGLDSPLPPGWMPPQGHGRPISYLPPDGNDYRVEFFIGCASTWRKEVFSKHKFSGYFEGYGLYEDLEFCIRASGDGLLYLNTRAQLAHYHDSSGRPHYFRYGIMVVRNGWYVWRKRWPHPSFWNRLKWWAITMLLTLCRFGDIIRGPMRRQACSEAFGRVWGMWKLLRSKAYYEPEV